MRTREGHGDLEADRASETRECKRPVCVSRQWALCGLLQHSPSPSVTTHSTWKGKKRHHQCSSLRVPLQLLFQHCSRASEPPLPAAHNTFIFHIYMQNIYLTLMQSNSRIRSLYFFFTLLILVSYNSSVFSALSCSQNIVSHLICLPSTPRCPINGIFNSLSASSNSESLGFASVSSTHTWLATGVREWEWILSPDILIAAPWLAVLV